MSNQKKLPLHLLWTAPHTIALRKIDVQPLIDKVVAIMERQVDEQGTKIGAYCAFSNTSVLRICFSLKKWAIKKDKIRRNFLWKGGSGSQWGTLSHQMG